MYHVVARHDGKLIREAVGHNRKAAERSLTKVKGAQDDDSYQPPTNKKFGEWWDEWLRSLRRPKENTRRSYVSTGDYAKRAFGDKPVRKLAVADVDRFLALIASPIDDSGEPRRARSPSTQAKHLRVLHACLSVAIREGHAARNPVDGLSASKRPKRDKPPPSYFTDDELARLWPELPAELPTAVYRYVCKAALTTGMREGELLALEWPDISFLHREIAVRRGYTHGLGLSTPKNDRERVVDLTPAAQEILEEWFQRNDCPESGLVFSNFDGGYLSASTITRGVLYPAMKEAGIPRVGEGGRKRTFHSFKHTFARIALENGAEITWVSQQLAHSSITLTVDTYGRWSRKAEKAQAARLEGAFAI
jgi:integrase